MAAPLAQWVPRLMGLSQDGSWPIQTPFCTSAVTVQPTEQWVQMFFLIVIGAPGVGCPMAPSAALTEPRRSEPMAARPPTVRPDRRRNARRSMASEARPAARACSLPLAASPLLRLISIAPPSLLERLVAVGPVESLDVVAFPITALGFVLAWIIGDRKSTRLNSS